MGTKRDYCAVLGVKEGRDTEKLCSSRVQGMGFMLVVVKCETQVGLGVVTMQFRRWGPRLGHINYGVKKSWKDGNSHYVVPTRKVTVRGLILHSTQLRGGRVKLGCLVEIFSQKMAKCGTSEIRVNDDETSTVTTHLEYFDDSTNINHTWHTNKSFPFVRQVYDQLQQVRHQIYTLRLSWRHLCNNTQNFGSECNRYLQG